MPPPIKRRRVVDLSSLSIPVPPVTQPGLYNPTTSIQTPKYSSINTDDMNVPTPEAQPGNYSPNIVPFNQDPDNEDDSPLHSVPFLAPSLNQNPDTNIHTQEDNHNLPDENAQSRPRVVPIAPTLEDVFSKAKQDYLNVVNQPVEKQGLLAQIAFQISQGAQNFARGMQGQPMQPNQLLGNAKKQYQIEQAQRKYAPVLQQHQQDQADQQNQAKIEQEKAAAYKARVDAKGAIPEYNKKVADAEKATWEAIQQQNPNFYKSIQDKGFVTQEDADFAQKNGLGKIAIGDFRPTEDKEIGGQAFERKRGEDWKPSTLPEDKEKLPVQQKLPDGTTYYTTGNKAADTYFSQEKAQAELDLQAGRINQQEYNEYSTRLAKWTEDTSKVTDQKNKLEKDAEDSHNEYYTKNSQAIELEDQANKIEDENPKEAASNREKAAQLRREATQALSQSASIRKQGDKLELPNKPTRASQVVAPTLGRPTTVQQKTITKAQIEQLKASGQPESKINDLIKKNNYKVIN